MSDYVWGRPDSDIYNINGLQGVSAHQGTSEVTAHVLKLEYADGMQCMAWNDTS